MLSFTSPSLFFFFHLYRHFFVVKEGVGKSSLISTYVSRYFPDNVPDVVTRVRLPPDPTVTDTDQKGKNRCVTTIVDSKNGDKDLVQAIANEQYRHSHSEERDVFISTVNERSLKLESDANDKGSFAGSSSIDAVKLQTFSSSSSIGSASIGSTTSSHSISTTTFLAANAIILVYDVDRVQTFLRLESHWLPLIKEFYDGKVRHQFAHCEMRQSVN